jgi:hypothetical protein
LQSHDFWKQQRQRILAGLVVAALLPVAMLNPTKEKNMDTEDFTLTETADDLVSAILDEHERELFDDELVEV